MEINFQINPVRRPGVAQAGQVDASSGIGNLARGVDNFSQGLQQYLKMGEEAERRDVAISLANQMELEINETFRGIDTSQLDPRQAARKKSEALDQVQRKFFSLAHKNKVPKDFGTLVSKDLQNHQSRILSDAHMREETGARLQLDRGLGDFSRVVQEQVSQASIGRNEAGHMALQVGVEGAREISAKSERLKPTIKRAFESVPMEKVPEMIDRVNHDLMDSYAQAIAGSADPKNLTSTMLKSDFAVPTVQWVNGQAVVVERKLTNKEKMESLGRVLGIYGQIKASIAQEEAEEAARRQENHDATLGDIYRQAGVLGKDLSVSDLRATIDNQYDNFTPKQYTDLIKTVEDIGRTIETSKKNFTDEKVFTDTLYRIQTHDGVTFSEIKNLADSGLLNHDATQTLWTKLDQVQKTGKSEFHTQFNETLRSIDAFFSTANTRTIAGDAMSGYQFPIRQRALQLMEALPAEEAANPMNGNRVVLQAAMEVLPMAMASQKDTKAGDRSQFHSFFRVMAGGDYETARHILDTTQGLSDSHRNNLEFGIAGLESVQYIANSNLGTIDLMNHPEKAMDLKGEPQPLVPEVKTKVPGTQGKVNKMEQQRESVFQEMQDRAVNLNKAMEADKKRREGKTE